MRNFRRIVDYATKVGEMSMKSGLIDRREVLSRYEKRRSTLYTVEASIEGGGV